MTPHKEAKKIILDLLDAGHDAALVQIQDGGDDVDVVFSRVKGQTSQVMGLPEAERRMDAAIRKAWKALTGKTLRGDPVQFVNTEVKA